MRYATVCSGIEAPTAAWHPLGWKAAFFSEIEPFPCAVLAHHYPDVPNLGDMTAYESWPAERIDLLCGGTPCQSFSVAGKRGSLADDRGNLALVFCRIADRYDPEFVVWENVPGVLSTDDNAFGCFLAELAGCDTTLVPSGGKWTDAGVVAGPKRTAAWRVIDAQGFVPQRRERVFVVCTRAGSRFHPADVLFETEAEAFRCLGERAYTGPLFPEREGVRGDTAEGREARERAAAGAARSVAIRGRDGTPQAKLGGDVANAILTPNGGRGGVGVGAVLAAVAVVDVCPTLNAGGNSTGGSRQPGMSVDTADSLLVAFTQNQREEVRELDVAGAIGTIRRGDAKNETLLAFDWRAAGDTACGTSRSGTPPQRTSDTIAIAFRSDAGRDGSARTPSPDAEGRVRLRDPGFNVYEETAPTLDASAPHGVGYAMQVRRLLPVECARLQAFADDFLSITYKRKPAADGPQYRALGNAMCADVLRWIGDRIQQLVSEIA